MTIDREQMRIWLAASCGAQGIGIVVTDANLIMRVEVLLRSGGGAERRAATRAPPVPSPIVSPAPIGADAERIESAPACLGRGDGGVVEDRGDDRGLTA